MTWSRALLCWLVAGVLLVALRATEPGAPAPMVTGADGEARSTSIRDDSVSSSGSSLEISSTAAPSAAFWSIQACNSALAPTSTPRVGSSRISRSLLAVSHFDSTTFCWLPPESDDTIDSRPVRSATRSKLFSTAARSAPPSIHPARAKRDSVGSVAFSRDFIPSTNPCFLRSSGTKPIP